MTVISNILMSVITTLIATAIVAVIKEVAHFLAQYRKDNERLRYEQLKSLHKSFSVFSCSKVAKSQDRNYVIEEIRKLIGLSEEYVNLSHPDLRKEMVFPFMQLCKDAEDYLDEVSWDQPRCKSWMKFPIIRIFFQAEDKTEHTIEEIKTCYKDLYKNLRYVLKLETRIWNGLIAANDTDLNIIISDYHRSLWYSTLYPCVSNESTG